MLVPLTIVLILWGISNIYYTSIIINTINRDKNPSEAMKKRKTKTIWELVFSLLVIIVLIVYAVKHVKQGFNPAVVGA